MNRFPSFVLTFFAIVAPSTFFGGLFVGFMACNRSILYSFGQSMHVKGQESARVMLRM